MIPNQIIQADALEAVKSIPNGCIDLIVTDPPYLCNYRDRFGQRVANDTKPDAVLPIFPELYRTLKPNSYCLLFCGWNAIAQFSGAWETAGFRVAGHIIWEKSYSSSARHVQYRHESAWVLTKAAPKPPQNPLPDVMRWTYSGNRHHPTEKAVEVIAPLVRSFSKRGDLVLDPFLGSGTTAVAAALHGRGYLGCDLEARYCDLANERLAGVQRHLAAKSKQSKLEAVA